MRPSIRSEVLRKLRTFWSTKTAFGPLWIEDKTTRSAQELPSLKAESFIRGATLRTRGRAGRSAEDRLLCKQEALGSNPSRSTPLEVQSKFRPARIQFGLGRIPGFCSDWL